MPNTRTKVNRSGVVLAALLLVDDVGLDGLTIRGVAKVVGVPPMSLYSHFAHKEQLLDLMYEEITSRIYSVERDVSWEGALTAFCHNIHRELLAHPKWLPLMSRPAPVLVLPGRERVLSLMMNAGFTPGRAMSVLSSAGLLALSLTQVQIVSRSQDGESQFVRRFENLKAGLVADDFGGKNPITAAALTRCPTLDLNATFSLTVEAFVAGLASQLASMPAPHSEQTPLYPPRAYTPPLSGTG